MMSLKHVQCAIFIFLVGHQLFKIEAIWICGSISVNEQHKWYKINELAWTKNDYPFINWKYAYVFGLWIGVAEFS